MSKSNISLIAFLLTTNPYGIARFYHKAGPFYAVPSTRKYFIKNNFLSDRQNNPIIWQNEQKVSPPITKSIRHVRCSMLCYRCMNCVTYWLVTYTRTKRKNRPFIFMLKFMRKKTHNFLQSTIENQQKFSYLMSRSTPGTLCLRTRSTPAILYLIAQVLGGTHITLSGFPECSGHSNKECLERSVTSNKEYPVCSGTSNNNHFADF